MARVLLLYAHPAPQRSIANRALADAVRDLPNVTFHDLYETYPDLLIDIDAEQDLLMAHDAIVVQHPFYWYSAPSIVKEWLDVVLEHGFAYGAEGRAIAGKVWMHALTTGGREVAYTPAGTNRYSVHELLRPFEATAALCRCDWRAPFIVHAAHLLDATALAQEAQRYRAHITALAAEPAAQRTNA